MEGEFRFALCLRRRCSFIFHPQPPFLSDCGGGCRDGRCRGGGCR
ncbi:unnamed protein product [Brassica rapa subsp. trilocularis]|uniref:(rape) hypothetical protein n=1 Tax=Brassica napus TaxID=3708 RepID=A0A816NKF6_BRANA|nr:unnamed protein product [Brassica napus]